MSGGEATGAGGGAAKSAVDITLVGCAVGVGAGVAVGAAVIGCQTSVLYTPASQSACVAVASKPVKVFLIFIVSAILEIYSSCCNVS